MKASSTCRERLNDGNGSTLCWRTSTCDIPIRLPLAQRRRHARPAEIRLTDPNDSADIHPRFFSPDAWNNVLVTESERRVEVRFNSGSQAAQRAGGIRQKDVKGRERRRVGAKRRK